MHDSRAAIEEIKGLSPNAHNALSHIIRNGLMLIISANRSENKRIEEAVGRMEREMKEMGL